VRADAAIATAQAAETKAGERFHEAEEHGFPRDESHQENDG
jgi:hypothetical protein